VVASDEAVVDVDLARAKKASAHTYLADAVPAARQALADNPRDTSYQQLLSAVRTDVRTGATTI